MQKYKIVRTCAATALLLGQFSMAADSSIMIDQSGPTNVVNFDVSGSDPNCLKKDMSIDSQWREHVCVRGSGEASYEVKPSAGAPVEDKDTYDVVVVGSGLAGLSSSVYLSNKKKKVLLLEKSGNFGGLASGASDEEGGEKGANEEINYGRGAAYWTSAYEEEQGILNDIGLGNFVDKYAIPDPIDSYMYNGKLYKDVWAEETMNQLPASFRVFHFQVQYADIMKQIPDQPIEDADTWGDGSTLYLDTMNTKAWLLQMPGNMKQHMDELQAKLDKLQAKKRQTKEDKKTISYIQDTLADGQKAIAVWGAGPANGMQDIIDFLDLYCRSALGTTSESVSAIAFANFYISEIVTRYTTKLGTGGAASNMIAMLRERTDLVTMKTHTPALSIENTRQGVRVLYNDNKVTHAVRAKYAIYAGQIGFAPQLVKGLNEGNPEQASIMKNLGYAHYSVHNVLVEGHPYRSSYDTWIKNPTSTVNNPTDVILGLWMDTRMLGYNCSDAQSGKTIEGCSYRDFTKEPPLPDGEFTIYNPMPLSVNGTGYTKEEATASAVSAVDYLDSSFGTLGTQGDWRGPLEGKIIKVVANRWPFSVHIAKPGHFLTEAKILRQPFKRVYFANNNIGTPAFEEALYRGHCAALNVLGRLSGKFSKEEWSRCTNYTK